MIESLRINRNKSSICLLSNGSVEFISIENNVKYFMDIIQQKKSLCY